MDKDVETIKHLMDKMHKEGWSFLTLDEKNPTPLTSETKKRIKSLLKKKRKRNS